MRRGLSEIIRVTLALSFPIALGIAVFLTIWIGIQIVYLNRVNIAESYRHGVLYFFSWALFASWITRPGGFFDSFGRSGVKTK